MTITITILLSLSMMIIRWSIWFYLY